jgi:acetylcholinesterase/cholinesterase
MFWIYGGAYDEGMNYGPLGIYDGSELAAQGQVCVVATNYRLGVLGFLVTEEHKGNYAIQDQRAAMKRVQANVANFGGNPLSVTIWGESAGAMSVSIHLVSPNSAGLFHRAIMESNVAAFRYTKAENQYLSFGREFASLSGCVQSNLTCLRALDAKDAIRFGEKAAGNVGSDIIARILEGGHVEDAFAMQWSPVVDPGGGDLPDLPLHLFTSGKFNKVPVLLGTNQDEGATFVYAGVDTWLPEFLFPYTMDAIFGKDASLVLDFYQEAAKTWHDTRDSLSYVLTDYWFKCSGNYIAKLVDAAGLNAFVYRFEHILSFPGLFPTFGLPTVCENRTCHATELPFVFHQHLNYTLTADEEALSRDFVSYWTAFARTSDVNGATPAGAGSVYWPRYNVSDRLNMRMAVPRSIESSDDVQQNGTAPGTQGVCDFFDNQVGYDW